MKKKKGNFVERHGMSVGYAWVFGLVSLFGLGILYVVFSQVFSANLVPIIKQQVTDSNNYGNANGYGGINNATKAEIFSNIDRYMRYFNIVPFVLFFAVVVFMIVAAWRRDTDSEQF